MVVFKTFEDYKTWVHSVMGQVDITEEELRIGWALAMLSGDQTGIIMSVVDIKWIDDEIERVGEFENNEDVEKYIREHGCEDELPAEMRMLIDLVGAIQGNEELTNAVISSVIQWKRENQHNSGELVEIVNSVADEIRELMYS